MNDTNYRNQLKNQIKEAYGKVTYTYTAHHKLADRLEKKNRHVKDTQIVLTAFSACGFFALTVTNKIALAWLSGISSVLSLFLSIYTKEYKINLEIIYVFLTIFLYLLKCPQSLILSALRAFCFCGKPHISRSIFLYFRYQAWLKSW